MSAGRWPTEIRVMSGGRELVCTFDDGARIVLPAELLRVESPSAEVRGHGGPERKTPAGKAGVAIMRAEPVGSYAVRLVFDDGHSTGLYEWRFLQDLHARRDEAWRQYLARLAALGLSRET